MFTRMHILFMLVSRLSRWYISSVIKALTVPSGALSHIVSGPGGISSALRVCGHAAALCIAALYVSCAVCCPSGT